MVNINIKFSNKTLYLLIGILTLLAVAGVAIALNSGDYTVHGHDASELDLSGVSGGGIEIASLAHLVPMSELTSQNEYCTVSSIGQAANWWVYCQSACSRWCLNTKSAVGGYLVDYNGNAQVAACICNY
tara:strand:- start:236 stop:622 length:387 start_codon:yes stop_codon:yes gene_type:complete